MKGEIMDFEESVIEEELSNNPSQWKHCPRGRVQACGAPVKTHILRFNMTIGVQSVSDRGEMS
jgi:hypothetical protein